MSSLTVPLVCWATSCSKRPPGRNGQHQDVGPAVRRLPVEAQRGRRAGRLGRLRLRRRHRAAQSRQRGKDPRRSIQFIFPACFASQEQKVKEECPNRQQESLVSGDVRRQIAPAARRRAAARGEGQYIADLELPGMLHVAFVRSPRGACPHPLGRDLVARSGARRGAGPGRRGARARAAAGARQPAAAARQMDKPPSRTGS